MFIFGFILTISFDVTIKLWKGVIHLNISYCGMFFGADDFFL